MKYYKIDFDFDTTKVIGHYPQTDIKKGYNPGLSDSHRQVKPYEFPNFIPNLELELHKEAKATDYIQKFVSFGMVINARFKSILQQFKLPPHAFYPIKVYHKGDLLEYFWFHYIIDDFWQNINMEKSTVQVYKKFEFKIDKIISIPKLEDIDNLKKSLTRQEDLRFNKIYFKSSFPKYDVYETQELEFIPVISEPLLEALQEAGMTGFRVKPFDKIICE
ncbi:imm11 family protein [Tenacibaculum sp. TC6]|uniref:imm11 family protein n=1 Tax=Tenacibaculum sp. TC6 TaxID=3423223 RepID=UPI003D35DFCF